MSIQDPLIIYPAVDANSFVSLTSADGFIDYHENADLWDTLSDDDKKRKLIKAYTDINALEGFVAPTAPDPIPGCLDQAQSYTAVQYLVNTQVYDDRRIKQEKLANMSTTYQDTTMLEGDTFPESVVGCLKDYGALQPNQSGAVGAIRKTRYA